jgi:hypothetical protein
MRIKFTKGNQRKFLQEILVQLNCPSLRAFKQFGFDIPYSTLKNYFNESRTLPEIFFNELCSFSKFNKINLNFKIEKDNFGQIIGGKKSKKKKRI